MRRALEGRMVARRVAPREAKKRGKLHGIGMASCQCTAWGPGENGTVTLEQDGTFSVVIGTQSNGRANATAYAQIVAQIDVDPVRVKIIQGDTDIVKTGGGTGGSRSIPVGAVGGDARARSARRAIAQARGRRAGAATGDIEFADGAARVIGTDRKTAFENPRSCRRPNRTT